MKKLKFVLIIFFILLFSNLILSSNNSYDVESLYNEMQSDNDIVVLLQNGNIEKPELILSKNKIDKGTYKIKVSRKSKDLYRIDGSNIYIKTKYCWEYASSKEAILNIDSYFGTIGKLIFLK